VLRRQSWHELPPASRPACGLAGDLPERYLGRAAPLWSSHFLVSA
jgi:hypothetical protein